MKKYIIISLILLSLIVIPVVTVKAVGLYYVPENLQGNVASTTAAFIIGGVATTTKTISSDGLEQVSWLVAIASSTTPPTVCWTNQYSNNGTDWYTEDTATTTATNGTTSIFHPAPDKQECFIYATSTNSNLISRGSDGVTLYLGRKIVVPNLDTIYTRTIFSILPGGRGRLDVRSSLKNEVVLTK